MKKKKKRGLDFPGEISGSINKKKKFLRGLGLGIERWVSIGTTPFFFLLRFRLWSFSYMVVRLARLITLFA